MNEADRIAIALETILPGIIVTRNNREICLTLKQGHKVAALLGVRVKDASEFNDID